MILGSSEWGSTGRGSVKVSINKLGMAGQLVLPLKSSNSTSVTEIKSWAENPLRSQ